MYTRPFDTAGPLKPAPTSVFQRIFGPDGGSCEVTFSSLTPLRVGPRSCGQSPARTGQAAHVTTQSSAASQQYGWTRFTGVNHPPGEPGMQETGDGTTIKLTQLRCTRR